MTQKERAINLKLMDEFIFNECSDTTWAIWITYGCPDDDNETVEDYEIWVEEEKEYKEMVTLFKKLVKGSKREKFINEYLPKSINLL